jgi:hypothetical protein
MWQRLEAAEGIEISPRLQPAFSTLSPAKLKSAFDPFGQLRS